MERACDRLKLSTMTEVLKNMGRVDGVESIIAKFSEVPKVRHDVNVVGSNRIEDFPSGCTNLPTDMQPVLSSNCEQLT